jgi:DNA-binding MarR family transcriptional regulator
MQTPNSRSTLPTKPTRSAPRPSKSADTVAASANATRSWLSVVRAYNLCDELLARRLSEIGVRVAEHEILANLRHEPGLSQQLLAARCFSAKSHVSGLVADLEQRGWLRREADPNDARAKRLFLDTAGAKIAERTACVQSEVVGLMAAAVSSKTMAQVQAAMEAVSEALSSELRSRE